MKPVWQTCSNCFSASAASILETGLNRVPRKRDGDSWLDNWRDWLERRGLSIEWYSANRKAPRGWSILTVKGRKETHAVVCFNGIVMHDPKRKNLKLASNATKVHYYVFTVINPKETR